MAKKRRSIVNKVTKQQSNNRSSHCCTRMSLFVQMEVWPVEMGRALKGLSFVMGRRIVG